MRKNQEVNNNNSFQNIICTEVLEHLPFPELAIRELSRVICEGGTLIITAPFASYTHMAPYHYCSGFDKYWYEEILKKYGWEIEEIVACGNYFDTVAQDIRRIPFICQKYGKRMNILQKLKIYGCVRMCNKMSQYDKGSSEYRTETYMVKARKV